MTQRIGLEAALEMSGWTRNVDRYMSDLDRMNSGTSSAAGRMVGSFDSLGKTVIGAGALMGGALVAGATAAGAAMGGVIVKGTKMAAAMEAQVSGIVAVLDTSLKASGTSTADAIAQLNAEILGLSIDPSLKVDAVQAADAIEMLARNGLSLTEISEGAAKSTVLLANATSADFGTAADIATDVMALFNIEAANMSEAVNGITSVVNNSKFGIQDYQLALAQGGGVAAAVGVEFDDFNTSIAAMSPFFASGSDAGTSFKTMLQRLAPTTGTAITAMSQLGLYGVDAAAGMNLLRANGIEPLGDSMGDIGPQLLDLAIQMGAVSTGSEDANDQFQEWLQTTGVTHSAFFDATGQMKSMADISAILNEATAGLSEEQKNMALSTIFGTDAMRAAFGLAASGEVIYTDIEEATKALGLSHEELADAMEGGLTQYEALQLTMQRTDAEQAAKTRIDNFAGALEIMQGVIDAVMLQIGQKFLPVWRGMAETFTKLAEEQGPKIVHFFGILAGWLADRLPTVIDGAVQAISKVINVLSLFAIGAAHGGNVLESVLYGIEEVMAGFLSDSAFDNLVGFNEHILSLADTLNSALGIALQFVSDHATEFAGALAGVAAVMAAAAMVTTITALSAAIASLFTPMGLIIAGAALLGAAWAGNWGGIQEKTQAVIDAIAPYIDRAVAWLNENIPMALTAMQTKWNEVWPAIQATGEAAWTTITTAWANASTWLETNIPTAITTLQTKWNEVWPAIQTTGETVWTAITAAWTTATTWLETNIPTALTTLQTKWNEVWPAIQTTFETVWAAITTAWTNASTWLETTIPTALTNLQTTWETVSTALQTAWQLFIDFFGPTIDNLVAGFTDMTEGMAPVSGKLGELWEAARPVLTKLGIAIGVVAAAINIIFLAAIRQILEVVAAVMPQVDDIVIGVIDALIFGFEKADEALNALERVFRENWPKIQTAVRNAWTRIKEWLEAVQEWFETKLPGYLTTLAEAFSTEWENMRVAVADMWEATRKVFDIIGIWIRVTIPGWVASMATKWQDAWTTATSAVTGAWATIKGAFDEIKTWLEVTLQNAFSDFKTFIDGFSIPNPFSGILGTLSDLAAKIPGVQGLLDSMGRSAGVGRPMVGAGGPTAFPGDLGTLLGAAVGLSSGLSKDMADALGPLTGEAAKMDEHLRNYQARLRQLEEMGMMGGAGGDREYIVTLSRYNDMLDRRNELEREMMSIQNGIKRADAAQARVTFLEQQSALLDIIETKGLDIQEILGGVDPKDFGANADPKQILFLANRISEALARQMEAELRIRAQTIEERAAQDERRRQIEDAIAGFEASRTEFVKQLGTLGKYGGTANIFNEDVLESLATQIETAQLAAESAIERYEQSGMQQDFDFALQMEHERLNLIRQYGTELEKIQRVQATQNRTRRLEAQAELLRRAAELGIEDAAWDIQFGDGADAEKLLQLVEAISDEENRRALFDLQNIRLFKDLETDLGLSGSGAGIFDRFKAMVLDPIWAQLQDMGKTLDERFGLVIKYRKEQERILAINRLQEETGFLQTQAELLKQAQAMGLDAFTWDIQFGRNADPSKLLNLVQAIAQAENEKALFDLQNIRIFQGLTNDLDVSGEGSGLFGTFKANVLDPLWEQMNDINRSEEERYLLAQQYRREQEKILRLQQAQSQLDFLQQQMDLVKLVADNGLDAATIFQGLEFGVNASIDDLIAAVTRAVEAMVGQVQSELDMHSPSRVMKRLGMMAMAGFTSGIDALTSGPAQAVRRSMSGMMTTAGQTVRNVNMNMGGVSINNGMSEALFQARVSQTIRRSI